MTTQKRSSYPSRQLRGGPAPLASFEDLSDEISSPEEPAALLSPDTETEDDTKTCSEGATPSTPRVLAQTPSTPLAFDGFSAAGTPESFGPLEVFPGSSSRPMTPLPPSHQDLAASRGSIFSPRASPLFGRHSKSNTPELIDVCTSNSSLDSSICIKAAPATPSPRSARKLFSMSFFKPREDKSPSPTASPKSPRQTSPEVSLKSPRRSSPFSGLFKGAITVKDEPETASSPTKKRSHFAFFLRPKEERRTAQPQLQEPISPAETSKKSHVFSHLFTRSHHKDSCEKTVDNLSISLHTAEDQEWDITSTASPSSDAMHFPTASTVPLTPTLTKQNADTSWIQVTEVLCIDSEHSPLPQEKHNTRIFESIQDILNTEVEEHFDPLLRLGLSPSAERGQDMANVAVSFQDNHETQSVLQAVSMESPESEAEIPDADPAILKAVLKGKELEAETLLREDSFDAEEFPAPEVDAGETMHPEKDTSRHRDKLAAFRVNPVDRPRCTAPVSFASLDAYINKIAQPCATSESSSVKAKLKVILPGEEFEHRERQPKKPVYQSWFEFCEVGLRSPRSRRRQLSAHSPSSFPEQQEVLIQSADERRAESVDLGAMGTSDDWAVFESKTSADCQCDCHVGHQCTLSETSSRSSCYDDFGNCELNTQALKDEEVEPLVKAEETSFQLLGNQHTAPHSDYAMDPHATRISQEDSNAQSSICLLPDCVFSMGGEPESSSYWANGVMDLLASLPSPKHEPTCVTNGNGRLQDDMTGYESPLATFIAEQGDGL